MRCSTWTAHMASGIWEGPSRVAVLLVTKDLLERCWGRLCARQTAGVAADRLGAAQVRARAGGRDR